MSPFVAVAAMAIVVTAPVGAQTVRSVRTVQVYEGEVDQANVAQLLYTVSKSRDQVIGLHVNVLPSLPEERDYIVGPSFNGGLLIANTTIEGDSREMVISGNFPRRGPLGKYVLDGMFIVKDGGGASSTQDTLELVRVDKAAVRLNPAVTIVRRPM